jgi:hypothetical protein
MSLNRSRQRPPSLVVGIRASAGGLAAYRSFFDHMPHDNGNAPTNAGRSCATENFGLQINGEHIGQQPP